MSKRKKKAAETYTKEHKPLFPRHVYEKWLKYKGLNNDQRGRYESAVRWYKKWGKRLDKS